jgi:hypothetical protein
MKLHKNLVPTSKNYREEIEPHSFLYSIEEPKCKLWNKDRLMAWLKENPIPDGTDGQERMWLISEESNIHKMLSAAAAESEATAPSVSWTDNKVMCWLYCCMYDERVRPYFVSKDDVMTRPELDARNNEDRPLTV